MSAAVQQGRIPPELDIRDRWEPVALEPQTPLSAAARARIAENEATVARLVADRFGPDSMVAQALFGEIR